MMGMGRQKENIVNISIALLKILLLGVTKLTIIHLKVLFSKQFCYSISSIPSLDHSTSSISIGKMGKLLALKLLPTIM